MNTQPALRLVKGRTVHARFTPFIQRFSYGLFMIDIDIDRLDEARVCARLFNVDGPGLFSFRTDQHGEGGNLRAWATRQLASADVDIADCSLRLVTFPRHLFYRFAPLSVWFAHSPDGVLKGVIYEVNNTFGDTHTYVASVPENLAAVEADKRFHVSPFFDVTGRYRFKLRVSENVLGLVIDTLIDGRRTHMATIKARYHTATDTALATAALTRPFNTLGVSLGIHWEALKLWIKGAGYRARPAPARPNQTLATPVLTPDNKAGK